MSSGSKARTRSWSGSARDRWRPEGRWGRPPPVRQRGPAAVHPPPPTPPRGPRPASRGSGPRRSGSRAPSPGGRAGSSGRTRRATSTGLRSGRIPGSGRRCRASRTATRGRSGPRPSSGMRCRRRWRRAPSRTRSEPSLVHLPGGSPAVGSPSLFEVADVPRVPDTGRSTRPVSFAQVEDRKWSRRRAEHRPMRGHADHVEARLRHSLERRTSSRRLAIFGPKPSSSCLK